VKSGSISRSCRYGVAEPDASEALNESGEEPAATTLTILPIDSACGIGRDFPRSRPCDPANRPRGRHSATNLVAATLTILPCARLGRHWAGNQRPSGYDLAPFHPQCRLTGRLAGKSTLIAPVADPTVLVQRRSHYGPGDPVGTEAGLAAGNPDEDCALVASSAETILSDDARSRGPLTICRTTPFSSMKNWVGSA
jgi:hypothetical protein